MALLFAGVIGLAVVGYFVGINDGVPREEHARAGENPLLSRSNVAVPHLAEAVPAAGYSEMRRAETGPTSRWHPVLQKFATGEWDPELKVQPSEADKRLSTSKRTERRAYNGAPPVIPHAIEATDDAACYACHGQGAVIGDRIARPMCHPFLAQCTQCHAPPAPAPFADVDATVANDFAGLPAPLAGSRAYPGAPPTIPHSTWMREQCLTCHNPLAGWPGFAVTHPWRTNCQQCHAPSAELEQAFVVESVELLPSPEVESP